MKTGSIFQRVAFLGLPGNKSSRLLKKQLRLINKRLSNAEPRYYAPFADSLKPAFAQTIHELKLVIDTFSSILSTTVGSSDQNRARMVQVRLIELFLMTQGLTLKSYDFSSIAAEAGEQNESLLKWVDARFRSRVNALKEDKLKTVFVGYREAMRLWSLCNFDFRSLLSHFSPQTDKNSGTVAFAPCRGGEVIEQLMDLHFILGAYQPTAEGLRMLRTLGKLAKIPENKELFGRFAELDRILDEKLQASALLDILHSVQMDPSVEYGTEDVSTAFLGTIRSDIIAKFTRARNAHIEKKTQDKLQTQVFLVFKSTQLFDVGGYTAEISQKLQSADLPQLRYILPLRILKTYGINHYTPTIEPLIESFFGSARFLSSEFRQSIHASYVSCSDCSKSVAKFEEDGTDEEFSAVIPYLRRINDDETDRIEPSKASRVINNLNERADAIVKQGYHGFAALAKDLTELFEDSKSGQATIIENYRYLMANEHDTLNGLEDAIDSLNRLSNLMSNFVIKTQAVKESLKKTANTAGDVD